MRRDAKFIIILSLFIRIFAIPLKYTVNLPVAAYRRRRRVGGNSNMYLQFDILLCYIVAL